MSSVTERIQQFCARFNLRVPILLAPMAGVPSPALSIAVATAGGLGSCGALLMKPDEIVAWADEVRRYTNGAFQLNLWIPDPPPKRYPAHEARLRQFLGTWGPAVPPEAADAAPLDFAAQCEALLAAGPAIVSSVMGLYPPDFVTRLKARGIAWFANISTVAEAREAEAAGADGIVVQGLEAGADRR
jgi:nitronate monooxygenase